MRKLLSNWNPIDTLDLSGNFTLALNLLARLSTKCYYFQEKLKTHPKEPDLCKKWCNWIWTIVWQSFSLARVSFAKTVELLKLLGLLFFNLLSSNKFSRQIIWNNISEYTVLFLILKIIMLRHHIPSSCVQWGFWRFRKMLFLS